MPAIEIPLWENPEAYEAQLIDQARSCIASMNRFIKTLSPPGPLDIFDIPDLHFEDTTNVDEPKKISGTWILNPIVIHRLQNKHLHQASMDLSTQLMKGISCASCLVIESRVSRNFWKAELTKDRRVPLDQAERQLPFSQDGIDFTRFPRHQLMTTTILGGVSATGVSQNRFEVTMVLPADLHENNYDDDVLAQLIKTGNLGCDIRYVTQYPYAGGYTSRHHPQRDQLLALLRKWPLTSLVAAEMILSALSSASGIEFHGNISTV